MADIPIQHKSGKGWLWLLLALVVVALLAWWLLDNDGNDVVEYTDTDTAAVATAPVTPGMATTGADTAMTDRREMAVGDAVNLTDVRVTSLAGDMAFNAAVDGNPMLVIFNQVPTPATAKEGKYDINPGSMVNISGSVRSASDPLPQGVTATIPSGTDRYIYADTIEMVG